jgi:predicted permease
MANSGKMGIPLVVLAFGEAALPLGVAYFFVVAIVQNTVGLAIYSGSFALSSLLRQPLIYAVLAVLLVTTTGLPVPQVVAATTDILGGMMVPSMLLLLGASLATLQVADLRPALIAAFGRLLIGFVTALVVIKLLDLSGIVAGVVFLMATMPTAVLMFVFADRFQRNAKQVAGIVVVSTVLTLTCLPLLVWGGLKISENGLDFVHILELFSTEARGVSNE